MPTTPVETTGIDLLDPAQTGRRLGLDDHDLLEMVNRGVLAAYDLGGHIRFRRRDVDAAARCLVRA